ncbi:outer membrane protein assembly factor BamB family protein [Haloarcula amylovorans]|uniref:outer membrane protein assembly factor BamB family protein n=1 Tax=Haloarcula amylovorans TaxID=2562280 RepID=UPI001075E1C8|nr:PQQ-binding-like beta-propeller repeat protein [Halomicroarcula amylolytica]
MSRQTSDSSTSRRALLKAFGGAAALTSVGGVGSALAQQSSNNSDSSGSTDALTGWTSIHGGPGNTSYAPDASGPKEGVNRRWVADPEPGSDSGYSTPVVYDGTAYVGANEFYAMDAATGDVRWAFSTDDSEREADTDDIDIGNRFHTPATDGETVYVGTGNPSSIRGTVYAVDPESGTEKWRFQRNPPEGPSQKRLAYTTITVDNDRVFAIGQSTLIQSVLVALDAETGEKLWSAEVGGGDPDYGFTAGAAAAEDGMVFTKADGTIVAFDGETGDIVWTFDGNVFSATAVQTLAIDDGTVYTSGAVGGDEFNDNYKLLALNADDGSVEWTFKLQTNVSLRWHAPIVDDESVYTHYSPRFDVDEEVTATVAVSREDGTLQYEGAKLGNVADGVVYTEDAAYAAADGSKLFKYGVEGEGPAVYGDGLFFGGDRVFALEPGQGRATLPEPETPEQPDEPADDPDEPTDGPDYPSETPDDSDDDPVCEA